MTIDHNRKADKYVLPVNLGLLLAICALVAYLVVPFKKIYQWDDNTTRIATLETKVADNEKNITVVQTEFIQISKQLDQINWQLNQLRRGK